MKKVWFIADLHLGADLSTLKKFIRLFKNLPSDLTQIYILGDLFYLWYGNDPNNKYLKIVKKILKKTTGLLPVYLMRGNRDFLLDQQFADETGISYLTDPNVVEIFTKNFLLTHGDLLFGGNAYIYLRKWLRNPLLLKIFNKLPFSWRINLAYTIKRLLNNFRSTKPIKMNQSILEKWLLKTKVKIPYLIAGHIHHIKTETLSNEVFLITLNDWQRSEKLILEWGEDQHWKFK